MADPTKGSQPAAPARMAIDAIAPIAEVTVLEDRARIVRRGTVTLPRGPVTVVVSGVAPVIVDKTVTARFAPAPGTAPGTTAAAAAAETPPRLAVADTRVRRVRIALTGELPSEVRALEVERRDLDARIGANRDALEQLQHDVQALAKLADQTASEIAEEAAWGRAARTDWEQHFLPIREQQRRAREEIVARKSDHDDLARRLGDIDRRIEALSSPAVHDRCSIEVDVDVAADAAADALLEVDYAVPGACWRPAHTARLAGDRLSLSCDACVWQNTGEDWPDASLSFSTERPSLGAEPPPLSTDRVVAQKRRPAVVVETREQDVHTTGPGPDARGRAAAVPGIDDGGETRRLKGQARMTVPSDGRPHRIPLFAFESPARLELVLMGEVAPAVVLRSEQANAAAHPVLAGPVDLIRESGYAGRSAVLYAAPGERFALGWGPDPTLRVHREHTDRLEEPTLLGSFSSWDARDHRIVLQISNIGDEARSVAVSERVPVSEVEKVQVVHDAQETTGGQRPDADGFVRWTVALRPFGQSRVQLRYQMKTHRDVVQA
jgi:uncharacterized protein (TIGR02231 family)